MLSAGAVLTVAYVCTVTYHLFTVLLLLFCSVERREFTQVSERDIVMVRECLLLQHSCSTLSSAHLPLATCRSSRLLFLSRPCCICLLRCCC